MQRPDFRIIRKAHEWLADRISWVQYPKPRARPVSKSSLPPLYKPRSAKVWLLTIIPVPFLFLVPTLLVVYLIVMLMLYLDFLKKR